MNRIYDGETLLALIIRSTDRSEPGTTFFTDTDNPLQVATMRHPAGYLVPPHTHVPYPRLVSKTQEVLVIRSGMMMVTFYGLNRQPLPSNDSCKLYEGDILVLLEGGHSFELVDGPCDFFEVKQGPYDKERDKIRFSINGSCPCGCGNIDCCLGG